MWFALALCIVAYLTMRAVRSGRLVGLLAAGLAVAAAFQVKMLEAWMVYPALALAYLVAAPRPRWTRVWHTLVAGLVSIAASLWWIVLVTVTPAAERPWVGGTADNSAWSMVFGYNGFGRVTGAQGTFIANFAGDAGLSRLVGSQSAPTSRGSCPWLWSRVSSGSCSPSVRVTGCVSAARCSRPCGSSPSR